MKRGPKSKKQRGAIGRKERPSRWVIDAEKGDPFDEPPDWFGPDAMSEWGRVVPLLRRNGSADPLYYTMVCRLGGVGGRVIGMLRGGESLSAAEVTGLRGLYGEFGLTPTTLAVPITKKPDPENPFAQYVKRPPTRDPEE